MDALPPPVLLGFGGVAAIGPAGRVELGPRKQRAVLGLLMLEPGTVLPLGRMIDRLWPTEPPAKAEVSVRGYVSNLRKALGATVVGADNVIAFREGGYVLQVARTTIDLHQFGTLVDDAAERERAGDLVGARLRMARAIELYAGQPLGTAADDLDLVEVTEHYEERRGLAIEAFTDIRLALGEHAQLPAALASEIARQPYRERLRAQLAIALYRSGRPVEALRSLHEARRQLAEDVGVEPGPELRRIEAAILAQDEATLGLVPRVASPVVTAAPSPASSVVENDPQFGRAAEVGRILAVLDRLPRRGGVIVVSGEAGIGKSRLLRGLREAAQRQGFAVGWDRCPESGGGAPYRSWRSAVHELLPDDVTAAEQPAPDQEAAGALLARQLGEVDRLRVRGGPVVVVIDDLQWADDATLSLLELLGTEVEQLGILLAVGVRRTGPTSLSPAVRDCLAGLARARDPLHLTLAGLTREDIGEWLVARTGRAPEPSLLAHVADLSGGNPFFVRELLALLESEGRLVGDFDGARARVPLAVQDVVRRRTSTLPPETQAVLTVAAVIGHRFDLDVLAGVVDLSVAETLARLEPALDDGVIEMDDPGTNSFVFSHALISSTLADELNAARLASLHARTTEVLESVRADDLEPWIEDLAFHSAEGLLAGTATKAMTYALRAAAAAEAVQSSAEVAVQLRRALAAAARLPGYPIDQRRGLLLRLGLALRDMGETDSRVVLVDAARLAEVGGDVHALSEILGSLDAESLWAGIDWNLHDVRVVAAEERALKQPGLSARDRAVLTMALAGELTYVDNRRSNELFAEARAMAEPLDDPVLSARILLRWFWSVSGPTGVRMRATIGDRLVELDADGVLPARLRPLAHLARVSAALELGNGELARSAVAAARELAHPVRTPTGWSHLQFAEAGLAVLDGDLTRARAHVAALRPALHRVRRYTADSSPASILAVIETESGDTGAALAHLGALRETTYDSPINWLEAWVCSEGGRVDEARAALNSFDGPLPDDWLFLPLTTAAVHAAASVGDVRFLRRHLPRLEDVGDRFAFLGEGGFTVGPVGLAVAAAHVALGDPAAARPHAVRAVDLAQRMRAEFWLPRAQQLLATLQPA